MGSRVKGNDVRVDPDERGGAIGGEGGNQVVWDLEQQRDVVVPTL